MQSKFVLLPLVIGSGIYLRHKGLFFKWYHSGDKFIKVHQKNVVECDTDNKIYFDLESEFKANLRKHKISAEDFSIQYVTPKNWADIYRTSPISGYTLYGNYVTSELDE